MRASLHRVKLDDTNSPMSRYLQRISLVPILSQEIWVGWELEGVAGEVDGLVEMASLSPADLAKIDVTEFPVIPAEYLGDFTGLT